MDCPLNGLLYNARPVLAGDDEETMKLIKRDDYEGF